MANYPQNLVTALPFFDAKNKQTFRQPYCIGSGLLSLQMRFDRLLPFTILRDDLTLPEYVYLVTDDGFLALDLTSIVVPLLNATTDNGQDYIWFEGATDVDQEAILEERQWQDPVWGEPGETTWPEWVCAGACYYFEIKFEADDAPMFSEKFCINNFPEFSDDPSNEATARVRIEAVANCPVGDVPPLGSQKLFLDTYTVEPEYELTKKVKKNGQEEEVSVWAKIKKRYRVKFYGVETIADFVATLPLYSSVDITDQYGVRSVVTDIEVKQPVWGDDGSGCVALLEISFAREFIEGQKCC